MMDNPETFALEKVAPAAQKNVAAFGSLVIFKI